MESDDELPPGCTAVRTRGREGWDGTCPCGATFAKKTRRELYYAMQMHWCEKHPPSSEPRKAFKFGDVKWEDVEAHIRAQGEDPEKWAARAASFIGTHEDAFANGARLECKCGEPFPQVICNPAPGDYIQWCLRCGSLWTGIEWVSPGSHPETTEGT